MSILTKIKNFFKYILDSYLEARAIQANWRIAEILHRTEYRSDSVDRIFYALTKQDLGSLKKK